jgi:hypothetical protein
MLFHPGEELGHSGARVEVAVRALGLAHEILLPDFLLDAIEGPVLLQGLSDPLGFVWFRHDELSAAVGPTLGMDQAFGLLLETGVGGIAVAQEHCAGLQRA